MMSKISVLLMVLSMLHMNGIHAGGVAVKHAEVAPIHSTGKQMVAGMIMGICYSTERQFEDEEDYFSETKHDIIAVRTKRRQDAIDHVYTICQHYMNSADPKEEDWNQCNQAFEYVKRLCPF